MTDGSSYISPPGGWAWPDDLLPELDGERRSAANDHKQEEHGHSSTSTGWSFPHDRDSTASKRATTDHASPNTSRDQTEAADAGSSAPRPQRHWRPRTCRICLETVNPSFHPPSENLPGMFQGAPSVTYDSDGGRLIRPCKCKGSSRYVHEKCLQEWRHADPSYGRRNFWNCPTCGFQYRLERMQWGHWISSRAAQLFLTFFIFITAVFVLGFVADPIINLYLDPYGTVSSLPISKSSGSDEVYYDFEEEDPTWADHFLKGIASLGLLGFVKVILSLGPWQWWQMSRTGLIGGSGRGNTGRDRMANISWLVVVLGIGTFLYAVWKGVRAWSRRFLEKAGERVMDVQGDDDADDDEDTNE